MARESTETDNLRIKDVRPLLPPACLLEELPRSSESAAVVSDAREALHAILSGQSDRLVVLAGPAAVDSPAGTLEYAARLATLAREVEGEVLVVMNCQLFTPVTPSTGPWPGLLFDPNRDGSYQINSGIRKARSLLLQLAALGLPVGLEFRDTITPQFFADLLAWSSVSAGSEALQDLVSGLSMPVGGRGSRSQTIQPDSPLASPCPRSLSRATLCEHAPHPLLIHLPRVGRHGRLACPSAGSERVRGSGHSSRCRRLRGLGSVLPRRHQPWLGGHCPVDRQ